MKIYDDWWIWSSRSIYLIDTIRSYQIIIIGATVKFVYYHSKRALVHTRNIRQLRTKKHRRHRGVCRCPVYISFSPRVGFCGRRHRRRSDKGNILLPWNGFFAVELMRAKRTKLVYPLPPLPYTEKHRYSSDDPFIYRWFKFLIDLRLWVRSRGFKWFFINRSIDNGWS